MGEKFTDGSIIQHLSKMRLRRETEGKPCPPPLRRSNTPAGRRNVPFTLPRLPPPSKADLERRRELTRALRGDDDGEYEYVTEDESEEETSQSTAGKKGKAPQRKPKKPTQAEKTSKHSKRSTASSLRPTRSASEPTEDEDTGSDANSTDESDARLCVGYPFLELAGTESEDSDASSPVEPEPTEDQPVEAKPIAKTKPAAKAKSATKAKPGPKGKPGPKAKPGPKPKSGPKKKPGPKPKSTAKPKSQKIVRFKVPVEALRNLRDTGNVNTASTTMTSEQDVPQYDPQPRYDPRHDDPMAMMGPPEQMTTGPEASTVQPFDTASTMPPFDMENNFMFNMENFDYSQGGMTGPGPTYPYDMDQFSAPPGWDPMAGNTYESPYNQRAGEDLLMEFIDPRVLADNPDPYGEVPNWIGPDKQLFDEPRFDQFASQGSRG